MTSPVIYRNVESILNVLNNYKIDKCPAVGTLLQVYNTALQNFKESEKTSINTVIHPLIVLEGLDGCGKSTTSKKLARRMNAINWCTPPKSIKHIRNFFDGHLQLETAFYALGNYIAALECSVFLKEQPVVMDRYWHSTAAYGISQAAYDFPDKIKIPPQGDSFYQWPEDLLKPDVVVFLDVNETIRLQRISRRGDSTTQENLLKNSQEFRNNVISVYKNMVNPEVMVINSNSTHNNVIKELYNKIQPLLKQICEINN